MAFRKKKNSEAVESLKLEVDLTDEPEALKVLEDLLGEVVTAGGGDSGVLVANDRGYPRTAVYGVDDTCKKALRPLMEAAVMELTEHGTPSSSTVQKLRQRVGAASSFAVPVRAGGKSIGLFYLMRGNDEDKLLDDAVGIYHLTADKVEITVQNAQLLKRLLTERRWLEAVVQHSSDGVVILDRDGLIVGYNLTMSKLTGWAIGEAVGQHSHQAFPLRIEVRPQDSTSLIRLGKRYFGERTDPVEAQLQTRDQSLLDVEVTGAPLFDEENHPLGWVMMLRDISRRKEMERLQKVFLSAVSHELHTPIAIIKGFAGLMSDPDVKLSPEVIREKAGIIVEESVRLEKMVGQMLEATRIQAGGLKPTLVAEDVPSLVARGVAKVQPLLLAAGCQVDLELKPDHFVAMVDGARLQQVVINLLENATKYSGRSRIEVSGHFDHHELVIAIGDEGPGVPLEERERLFEPFVRGKQSAGASGSGLGLYIAKAIIESHGGTLTVGASQRGGALFTISLPTRQPEESGGSS